MEQILSGYCRTIDASRIVLVEGGEADCDFEVCAYRDVCQIGQQDRAAAKNGGTDMNICLYGASSPALDRAYFDAAEEFGRLLAKNGHTLVYGGGAQGVMGAAARGAADAGENHRHRAELFKCRRHSV